MWVRTRQPMLLRAKTHLVLWLSVAVKLARDGGSHSLSGSVQEAAVSPPE